MNVNLPSYVVLAEHLPYAGGQVFDNSFLPGVHAGMRVTPGAVPIPDLKPIGSVEQQQLELGLLDDLNQLHAEARSDDDNLRARMLSFDTARGMQREAPDLFEVQNESAETKRLYGYKDGDRSSFAWQCLVTRRMLEAGVRTIELIHTGSNKNWDNHGNVDDHKRLMGEIDQPIAGISGPQTPRDA